jgi:predicted Fe-Mo cluster-binding NifX family protein
MAFGTFLKKVDTLLYSQYSLEKFTENAPLVQSNTMPMVFEQPVFKSSEERLLDQILERLDTLPEDNEAVKFCLSRQIPREKFNRLYYIQNIKDIVQLNEDCKESIKGEEPRLVIPFYDDKDQLAGVTCRALRGEALRYITVKVKSNTPLIFGLGDVDKKKPIYVVEGPIDSLFLNNGIAVAGTTFAKIDTLGLDKAKLVLIIDNQPRNKEVCGILERCIDQGFNVVIWPQNISQKDINEMVQAGIDVNNIILKNTYKDLAAKARFIAWKRC